MSQAVGLAMGFIIEVLPLDAEEERQTNRVGAEESPEMLPPVATSPAVHTIRKILCLLFLFALLH